MMKSIGTRKLTDRLIIILGVAIILIISLLFAHLCMYIKLSNEVLVLPKYKWNYHQDKNRVQIVLDGVSESTGFEPSDGTEEYVSIVLDNFSDLNKQIKILETIVMVEESSRDLRTRQTLGDLLEMETSENISSWQLFHMGITGDEMYPENSTAVPLLLHDLATMKFNRVEENALGTQFKLNIHYRNHEMAIFKPKRCARNDTNPPNQIYFAEFERHNAEIAAFHVDRLLGFRRAIPTSGRMVNMITQLMRISDTDFQHTFYTSGAPDENTCFTGNCKQYCDDYHPVCGNGEILEGSFMAYLPDDHLTKRRTHTHPWIRSYHTVDKAEWEMNPNYCEDVKQRFPLNESRHLLDFTDTAILDFLIGNRDRHGYQQFKIFGENSFHMHYDHGRSFGRPFFDDQSILAPVTQCCLIRASTLKTLLKFHTGPKPMSVALTESMSIDPIAPILWEPHLIALDRRIEKILLEIRKCIQKKPSRDVIIIN